MAIIVLGVILRFSEFFYYSSKSSFTHFSVFFKKFDLNLDQKMEILSKMLHRTQIKLPRSIPKWTILSYNELTKSRKISVKINENASFEVT